MQMPSDIKSAGDVSRPPLGDGGRNGRVTLVGAGPGDPELLTVKAVRAIADADVILFDALVSEDILTMARRDAELISVGKRGGRPSCRQGEINRQMLAHARSGKNVVRLKSGDPSIFGRSGEEIDHLRSEGIDAVVIPGITAASAMAASLGISLTHRDCAKSVRFVTGHSKNGGLPQDVDWDAIADPSTTTVFYMGAYTARQIVARLVEAGLHPSTPGAVAVAVSRPNAQFRFCALGTLSATIQKLSNGEPIVFGVGSVFGESGSQGLLQAKLEAPHTEINNAECCVCR